MGQFDHVAAALRASPLVSALAEMGASNDFSSLDKNSAKRHHFLPQFLLRGFSDESQGKSRLFQMEVSSRRAPCRVDVRSAASRHRLYTAVDEDGQPSNRQEGYLALVETHAAPALGRLMEDPLSLSPGDRATIAFFVAFQTMRTPVAARQVTEVANAAFQLAATEFYSDRVAFAERHRERHGHDATEHETEERRLETLEAIRAGRVRVSGEGGAAFAYGLKHAAEMAPMIYLFDWRLIRAPSGGLITSDRGYAIDDPTPPYPWTAQGLMSSDTSETTVPLGDRLCLALRPGSAEARLVVEEADSADIERLNLRTLGWGDTYVFAKAQSTLAALRVSSRNKRSLVIRPKPFCQVALIELDPEDDSLAEANVRRGWPARLRKQTGELLDYVVIPTDKPNPEARKLADDMAERRARKRMNLQDADHLVAQVVSRDPTDLTN